MARYLLPKNAKKMPEKNEIIDDANYSDLKVRCLKLPMQNYWHVGDYFLKGITE